MPLLRHKNELANFRAKIVNLGDFLPNDLVTLLLDSKIRLSRLAFSEPKLGYFPI